MAKKNNKGFSLIEIIIAIAVLSILLGPIVLQLSHTMKTNRKSKTQQYVNDSAVKLLEEVQSTKNKDLPYTPTTPRTVSCSLYNTAGTLVGTVNYTATDYSASSTTLGPNKDTYVRKITMNDLPSKVRSTEFASKYYNINYEFTESSAASVSVSGYTLASDGSLVQYDSNGDITSVIVDEDVKVDDPNEVFLGHLTKLDSSAVAFIPGTMSNYDYEAEQYFYTAGLSYLREHDYASYEQALIHQDSDSSLNSADFLNSMSRLIKLYIGEGAEVDGTDYYEVRVDVLYYCDYADLNEHDRVFKKNAFSQRFYTAKVPDIYMEYQPFTVDDETETDETGVNHTVTYTSKDYIMVCNTVEDTSVASLPVGATEEERFANAPRIYLYKPQKDQMTKAGGSVLYNATTGLYSFVTKNGGSNKVNIRLIMGAEDSSYDPESYKVQMYTNIDCVTPGATTNKVGLFEKFSSGTALPFHAALVKSHKTNGIINSHQYDKSLIKPLTEDKGGKNEFYYVTVQYTPDGNSGNTIRLTGAKGEN